MDIKELNDITGQILSFEDKIKATKWRIERMQAVGPHNGFDAKVELTTYGCHSHKDRSVFSLTKEEVMQVLERTLAEQEEVLEKYKVEFSKLQ